MQRRDSQNTRSSRRDRWTKVFTGNKRRNSMSRPAGLKFETLEARDLLVFDADDITWPCGGGELEVDADSQSENIAIDVSAGRVRVVVDGTNYFDTCTGGLTPLVPSDVESILVQGKPGNDTSNLSAVNVANGFIGLDGNIVIEGGDGNDIINGNAGIDFLNGNGFADAISSVNNLATPVTGANALTEASGLVVSRALNTSGDSILWIVQDDGPTWLYANNTDGSTLGYFPLGSSSAMTNVEWEDMAFYDDGSTKYIYIADIGDNDNNRTSITIYRFAEPTVPTSNGAHTTIGDGAIERIVLKYAIDTYDNGRARDAETLMVDPLTGDIYIVSKSERDPTEINAHLYVITASDISTLENGDRDWRALSAGTPNTLELTDLGSVAFPAGTKNLSPSAGDISFDGMEVLLKSDDVLHHYVRESTNESFDTLLTGGGGINPNGPVQIPTAKDQHNRESVAAWCSIVAETPSRTARSMTSVVTELRLLAPIISSKTMRFRIPA